MIRFTWNASLALPVLHALQDPRLEARCARAAAERYTESILGWIALGRSFTSRTGQLEQSIGWRPDGDGAVVYANAEHALYIEQGTGLYGPYQQAYAIQPKPGRKALRLPVPGGGYRFRRKITHPGTQAQPYFFADFEAREHSMLDAVRSVYADVLGGH
jgi:hypothetical protein